MTLSFSSSLSSNLQRREAGRQEEEAGSTPTKPQQPGKHNQAENHGGGLVVAAVVSKPDSRSVFYVFRFYDRVPVLGWVTKHRSDYELTEIARLVGELLFLN